MRRRGGSDGNPPEYLLSFSVWLAENRSPDPGPAPPWWNPDGEPYVVHCARREWSKARREWVRHSSGIDAVNRLYGPGYDPDPQEPDPRRAAEIERSIIEAVAAPAARRNRP